LEGDKHFGLTHPKLQLYPAGYACQETLAQQALTFSLLTSR
jgi:hypothetical protein